LTEIYIIKKVIIVSSYPEKERVH